MVFADDSYLVRVAVSALLNQGEEIELVTAVGDADALIRAVAEHRPNAVLTDIRMPPTYTIEGIDAAKRIRADYPDIGVVVLSQFARRRLRVRATRERGGWPRVPPEGARSRARRAGTGAAGGGRGGPHSTPR